MALAALFVAGCATGTAGRPTAAPPTGASASQPATNADTYGAPKVTSPLDTTKYQPNPCVALTSAQLRAIGIGVAGTVQQDTQGNVCHWAVAPDTNYAFAFDLAFPPGEPSGLANAYQAAGPGDLRRLPDVHGQPAVTEPSQNTGGNCTIYLGATDHVEYAVSVLVGQGRPQYRNPCSVAGQIADAVTATMKSGG